MFIIVNQSRRKTKIVKLTHGFEFLKKRTYLCENGKIIMKISRQSITRMRRKLKKFKKFLDNLSKLQSDVIAWCNKQNKRKDNYGLIDLYDKR